MRPHPILLLLVALLPACNALRPLEEPQDPAPQQPEPLQLANCILDAAALPPAKAAQELERLRALPQQQAPEVMLHKACLLGRPEATAEEHRRAQTLLDQLHPDSDEPNDRALLYLFRQTLNLHREIRLQRQANDHLKKRSIELQKKIELLKGLEKELETSHPTIRKVL